MPAQLRTPVKTAKRKSHLKITRIILLCFFLLLCFKISVLLFCFAIATLISGQNFCFFESLLADYLSYGNIIPFSWV